MGKVNDFIDKMISSLKIKIEDKDKPWLKFYEDMPEHIRYFDGGIYDAFKETALKYSSNIAYEYFFKKTTYKDLLRKIDKVAKSLKQFNIVENECVTICLPNTPEAVELIYACNKMGLIANVVHPLSSTADIQRAIDETNSSILFCSDVSMPKARNIKVDNFVVVPVSNELDGILKVAYNLKNRENLTINENMLFWSEFLSKRTSNKDTYVKRSENDPALIIYSGGTTGKPKGIIISNLNLNAMAQQTKYVCKEVIPGQSVLSALPLFHVFGYAVCIHVPLLAGMKCILIPKLDTKNINKVLKRCKPNVLPVVPTLLGMIIKDKNPGKTGFKDIKTVVCGGDYLSPELKQKTETYFKEHGSKAIVQVGYGLSEATGFCCATYPNLNDEKALGIPNSDTVIKIFEPNTDIETATGNIGEICVNGPTIMMGYINEDSETKKTIVMHNDGKTWLHTGDLGYVNDQGIFYYSSRLKRMIISNGYNIYPLELEEIICKNKYVDSCTVVAIPHKVKGQVPKAVIVLKKGIESSSSVKNEIRRYCEENITKYAQPHEFEFRNMLPRTAVGKVDFKVLQGKCASNN